VLFVTQATLVLNRRVASHRRLGRIGPVLALVVMGLGCFMLVEGVRRGYELSGDLDRAFNPPGSPRLSAAELAAGMLPPLAGSSISVSSLPRDCGTDIGPRSTSALCCFMLLALAPLAGEPVIHLVGHLGGYWPSLRGTAVFFLPIQLLFLFASAIYDKLSTGRVHPVSLWADCSVCLAQRAHGGRAAVDCLAGAGSEPDWRSRLIMPWRECPAHALPR
jgi:hypothetical protein